MTTNSFKPPADKVWIFAAHNNEAMENVKCVNCGEPWKEHNAVTDIYAGAGACPFHEE